MRIRDACAAVALGALMLLPAAEASASSHREAPFIAKMPKVDGTDFYMFRSYETGRGAFVTIIANFQPLQDKYGGPNYFTMDSEALYEIHIDNTGDGKEDITFQFRFSNALAASGAGIGLDIGTGAAKKNVNIPFINANLGTNNQPPPITAANQGSFRHVNETYGVKVVRGNRRTGTASDVTHTAGPGPNATTFIKPLDFIGLKSWGKELNSTGQAFADYNTYADAHIYPVAIPGCATAGSKIFVGQRHEQFGVLLGNVFDLVNATLGQLTDANGGVGSNANNPIGDKNITTIALELPIACPKGPPDVIGGWSTASVRQARVINPAATYAKPSREGGAWAQVSRLGSPLVNELVIGLKDKDKFNSSEPKDDGTNFATYITNPTLPAVLEALLGPTVKAPTLIPRADLVQAFATGVPGVNAFPGATPTVAEFLRLNVALPATASGSQNRLGALGCFEDDPAAGAKYRKLNTGLAGCDPAGFPNGRRPVDDVVDIALRVSLGALINNDADAQNRNTPVGDFIAQEEPLSSTFPYLDTPFPGAQ